MPHTSLKIRFTIERLYHRYYRRLCLSAMSCPTYPAKIRKMLYWSPDPMRHATIALALQRVRTEGIPGAVAEVGVYSGYTSRFLHEQAPERTLYLFDTFAGFPDGSDTRFRNTSINVVKVRLGSTQNINFRVGVFPETAKGLETEKFSLVYFDADKYDAARAAFEFFYPRLSAGGYFILHDFNSTESNEGVKKATEEFMHHKPELIVEIPDFGGTVLFRKISH